MNVENLGTMPSHHDPCHLCDLGAARALDQSLARFNDQSGFNVLASQQNFIMQQQAAWMEVIRQSHTQSVVNAQMLLSNIGNQGTTST